jgi:phosphoglycerate dehydrogenase-like enzyme
MPRVLYLGPPELLEHLRAELGPGYQTDLALEPEAVDRLLPETDVILDAYMKVRFDGARLARAAALKVVVTGTTGADHIDGGCLETRQIPLLTLRGQTEVLRMLTPAAELSWLLLMACARGLRAAVEEVLEGGWNRNNHPGVMLRGKTLGIVGCGRIGQHMARYARAFEMNVLGHDPFISPWPAGIEKVDLPALCAAADFVSVHVNLTAETRGLMGAAQLAAMKPGAILVNTSRGEIVDEQALAEGLRSGHIGGAGLDVLRGEPETDQHPLVVLARERRNVVITPHIGGFSPDAVRTVLTFCAGRIRSFFARS